MTVRAITGLVALNVAYAAVGVCLTFALHGYRSWGSVVGRLGLAYLLGVAAFGVLWTELLVVGIPFDGVAIVASLAALAAAGLFVGRALGRPRPAGVGIGRLGGASIVTAAGIASAGLVLESLFRAARLQSLQAYDAWAFWVPKAKALYFFGGLDEQVFTTTPGPSYPPLVPILDAASFHAMGRADVVTLHLQFWFLVLGAVAAIAMALHRRVPAWILWPSVVLVLVLPRFGERLLTPQADILTGLFFVAGALLVALWLREAGTWALAGATLLLAAGVLTKREGLAFAGCVLVGAAVASTGRGRRAWLELGAAAVAIGAAALPWRLWYASRDIPSDAPSAAESDLGRVWDALRLSADVLYATDLWSVTPLVASIALVAAAVWGDRRLALFLGAVLGLAFLGGAWVTFGYAELPVTADESVNPIVRYTGAIVFLAAAATPLLLASIWRGGEEPT